MAQATNNILGQTRQFLSEVWLELNKVNWSTREQLWQTTKVVIISTVVMAMFLFLVDITISAILNWFLSLRL